MKLIIILSFVFYSLCVFSTEKHNYEELIVQKKYTEIIDHFSNLKTKSDTDYFYYSIANFHQEKLAIAILANAMALVLNPFNSQITKNLMIMGEKLDQDKNISQMLTATQLRIYFLFGIIFLFFLQLILIKRKKWMILSSCLQLTLIGFYYFSPINSKLRNLNNISIVEQAKNIHLTPSEESKISKGFSDFSIIFIDKEIQDWAFIENFDGNSGWVNKNNLFIF